MNNRPLVYWTALVLTGLITAALHVWLVLLGGHRGFHPGGFGMIGFGLVILAGVWAFFRWRRSSPAPLDPLGDLAGEYVEGRIDRDEFFSRKAVLEEQS